MCFLIQSIFSKPPVYTRYSISGLNFAQVIQDVGFRAPMGMLDSTYYCTDEQGWGEVLLKLVISPLEVQPETYDCDNYAFTVMNNCSQRYGLNAIGIATGTHNGVDHAWNIFYVSGDKPRFMYFEPDLGMNAGYFEVGENGYISNKVFI